MENTGLLWLISAIFIFALFVFISSMVFLTVIFPYHEEIEYMKMEIRRSTSERERRHWEKKLKKLYVSCIPFFGKYIAKLFK